MSQNELPEELNDTERTLLALAPRASRIDRDRLMIRLGEQSAARGATPWKWATAASLLLALALGVRPAPESQTVGPQQVATPEKIDEAPGVVNVEVPEAAGSSEVAGPDSRLAREEFDWPRALASGRFDSSRPLTVRPEWGSGGAELRSAEVAVRDEAEDRRPATRTPMLRWGDERLRRNSVQQMTPTL